MQVFSCPEECAWVDPDVVNYNWNTEWKRQAEHQAKLKAYLIENGYKGKYTGGTCSFGVADGSAQYMLADGNGRFGRSFLIHLPYGDAYHYHGIQHFPKKAIVEYVKQEAKRNAYFARRDAGK